MRTQKHDGVSTVYTSGLPLKTISTPPHAPCRVAQKTTECQFGQCGTHFVCVCVSDVCFLVSCCEMIVERQPIFVAKNKIIWFREQRH